MSTTSTINTAKVTGRRSISFQSYEELLADLDRLGSGPVRQLGNWSPGQNFRHLATAYNNSIDGFTLSFPMPLRLMAKLFRKRLLSMSMPAGGFAQQFAFSAIYCAAARIFVQAGGGRCAPAAAHAALCSAGSR